MIKSEWEFGMNRIEMTNKLKEKLPAKRFEHCIGVEYTAGTLAFIYGVDFEKAKNTNLGAIKSTMRRLFPEHHPHELRYTFITRCKECGVNPELVMLWEGHEMDDDVKTSKVDRGYTDYSDEYQLQEAEKVNYKIPMETA